jgi:hypothetical protein
MPEIGRREARHMIEKAYDALCWDLSCRAKFKRGNVARR